MNRNQFPSPEMPERRPDPRHRSPLCAHDHGVDRSELTLFLLLVGAVGLAFANHTRVLTRFVDQWPEFATLVADLFRVIV